MRPTKWFLDHAGGILTGYQLTNARRYGKVFHQPGKAKGAMMDVHSVIREYPEAREKLMDAVNRKI